MIALIHGLGDVGGADAVPHLPDEGGGVPEGVHIGAVGPLAHSADDGLAGNQDFGTIGCLADEALLRDPQARVAQMDGHQLVV